MWLPKSYFRINSQLKLFFLLHRISDFLLECLRFDLNHFFNLFFLTPTMVLMSLKVRVGVGFPMISGPRGGCRSACPAVVVVVEMVCSGGGMGAL